VNVSDNLYFTKQTLVDKNLTKNKKNNNIELDLELELDYEMFSDQVVASMRNSAFCQITMVLVSTRHWN